MNIVLWILQSVLAVKLVSAAYSHGLRPDQTKIRRGMQRFGAATRPLLAMIALCLFLIAVGLVLPAAAGVAAWLTPWSAAVLAVVMLSAIGLHLSCRDSPKGMVIAVDLVLFALAAFVACGRWVIAPL